MSAHVMDELSFTQEPVRDSRYPWTKTLTFIKNYGTEEDCLGRHNASPYILVNIA